MDGSAECERGVSEFTGVAILIATTVLVTASIGVFVLVDPTDTGGPPDANFSFQYIDQSSVLIVTHDRGDEVAAGNLTLRSSDAQARWHELAGTNETVLVGPGDTVQLSNNNVYGQNVNRNDNVRVIYTPPSGNETELDRWDGS
ncbi:type IV pilin [Halobacteriales archaeon QH_10_67_22]|jgi:FlaG/FlaF family flagellin (archaellin)|nr:MAG: type IV pilin [Halobacteriales archaeon QH_10_67_22]